MESVKDYMDKKAVAQVLEQIAAFLELKTENPFRIRAFRTAARALVNFTGDLRQSIEDGTLASTKGIGPATLQIATELVNTGRATMLDELRQQNPAGLVEMLEISGLGVAKIKQIHQVLGIDSLPELEAAAHDGRLAKLPRFGPRTSENILKAIAYLRQASSFRLLHHAADEAEGLRAALERLPGVRTAVVAGDVRRRSERDGVTPRRRPDLVPEVAAGVPRTPLALTRPVALVAVVASLERLHVAGKRCSVSASEPVALALQPVRRMAVSLPTDARLLALEDIATQLRIDSVRATTAAGSGHPTSCASAADLVAAVFFDAMRIDPDHPRDPVSDRFVLSKGHAAPLLYAAWAAVGVLDRHDLTQLRQIDSDLEGHPTPRLPFVDVATGSLGQGLGVGLGLGLGARMVGTDARIFVLMGDGETAEGSVWEAAQLAAHARVDNLIGIVDVNGLGQSGPTMLDHDMRAYQRRFAAFGWRTQIIDGHDMTQITTALRRATRGRGAPSVILARTMKGKGLGEVEGRPGWHGRPLPADVAETVIADLEQRRHHLPPPPVRKPRRRPLPRPAVKPVGGSPPTGEQATREAYGAALVRLGEVDPRVVALDGDVKNSTFAERFKDRFPERFVECFIAEQNMVSVAGGLAAQGLVPFASSFACFLERGADQIRMLGISRSNVKLCGSHAGVSIGEDGPSQMALEDLAFFRAIPEAVVLYPGDAVAADASVQLAAQRKGLVYIRTTRGKTPALYPDDAAFTVGGLKVLRRTDHDRVAIVAAGITLHEALAAHDELAAAGIAVRVIDLYCVKPVDAAGLLEAGRACAQGVLTVEDHYAEGGLGAAVLEALGESGVKVHRLAVREIPRSGPPRKLLERYGIGRAAIVTRVRELA